MMKTKFFAIFFISILLTSGCASRVDKEFEDLNDLFVGGCMFDNQYRETAFVITSYEELQELSEQFFRPQDCEGFKEGAIDFEGKTLLVKFTFASGCEVEFNRDVKEIRKTGKLVYTIDSKVEGNCEKLVTSMNWALVDGTYTDASIDFVLR